MKHRLFFKIYDILFLTISVIIVLLSVSIIIVLLSAITVIVHITGQTAEAFKIAIYDIFFGFLLIGNRITLHFYISKIVRDEKKRKEGLE